jgi:hypothetical protein
MARRGTRTPPFLGPDARGRLEALLGILVTGPSAVWLLLDPEP